MPRPDAFQRPHVALTNLPYQVVTETSEHSLAEGGVLGSGRLVWTRDHLGRPTHRRSALAFIDEIGTVLLDHRWLRTVEAADCL